MNQLQSQLSSLLEKLPLEQWKKLASNIPSGIWAQVSQKKHFKIISFVLFGILLGLFTFLLGLQNSFPGKAVAGYAQTQIEQRIFILTQIAPIELGFNHISTKRIVIHPPFTSNLDLPQLLTLEKLSVPLLPGLLTGTLDLTAKAYRGDIEVLLNLSKMDHLQFNLQKIQLDTIPILNIIPYAFLKGEISLVGEVTNLDQILKTGDPIPQGKLDGKLRNITIRPKDLGGLLMGLQLPELYFSQIDLQVELGRIIKIKKLKLTGSLDGTIEGTIELASPNPLFSKVKLHLQVTLDDELNKALGPIASILGAFQCGNTINIDISGTFKQMNVPIRRRCG